MDKSPSKEDAQVNSTAPPAASIPEIFSAAQNSGVYEEPMLQKLPAVFNPYICSAVRKIKVQNDDGTTSLKASVTMDFPRWALVDCLMSLDFDASRVNRLAQVLLGIRVESEKQFRYVYWPSGARMRLDHDIKLSCISGQAINDEFGTETYNAVLACGMRQKEADEGNILTECVSVVISEKPWDGLIVNLALGTEEGNQIRKKLYT
jgi:hypothetical protein